ncbi:MAG: hypothetical protein J5722_08120, partial [Oscillospiraceae bacterium]|nr:hypothetical protein [Oscillospiraceae bacterium]
PALKLAADDTDCDKRTLTDMVGVLFSGDAPIYCAASREYAKTENSKQTKANGAPQERGEIRKESLRGNLKGGERISDEGALSPLPCGFLSGFAPRAQPNLTSGHNDQASIPSNIALPVPPNTLAQIIGRSNATEGASRREFHILGELCKMRPEGFASGRCPRRYLTKQEKDIIMELTMR